MRDGPRRFSPDFTCLDLLRCRISRSLGSHTGLSPAMVHLSKWFCSDQTNFVSGPTTPYGHAHTVWALPLSLAATDGIDVSFFSYRY